MHQSDWQNEGVPFYRTREIVKLAETGTVENDLFISNELFHKLSIGGLPHAGDLMITAVGTIGKVYIVREEDRFYFKDASVISFRNYGGLEPYFLKSLISSSCVQNQIFSKSAGTTVDTITIVKANDYLLPIPPIEEQKRINKALIQREQQLIAILNSRKRYRRILTETPTSLRQQLIQAAIQGQLVPQNPNDVPASILLERIAQERTAKLGKKATKSMSRIERRGSKTHATYHEIFSDGSEKDISDEIPFDLPENWVWCRLGCLVDIKSGSTYKEVEAGVLYVKVGDMNLPENKIEIRSSSHFAECPDNAIIPAYSIIFPKRGGAISTNKKRTVKNFKICVDLNTMALSFPAQIFDFARVWFENIELEKIANGSTIPQINNKDVEPLLFPLPPLGEQLRICNRLGKMLRTIEESRE